jgi:hypothetical protein
MVVARSRVDAIYPNVLQRSMNRLAACGLLVGVLVGAVLAGGGCWAATHAAQQTPGFECPLGCALLAFGTAVEQEHAGLHWYNFTVESSCCGFKWGDLRFAVRGPVVSGSPGSDSTMKITDSGGGSVANYSFSTGNWVNGASIEVSSTMTAALFTGPTNLTGVGEVLSIIGTDQFQGTVSANIP